ncbi:hypothetical protein [Bergeriella denitrificans]|uniref:Uncharacterized protein n=1 Tax=Bergeriella denitrificans TaxID=494 RepID=A0A378UHN8_BERDE|nr:hypothetical protein [Bergeriella denitrificans]STZ76011.1 Uncharacterised protein [Bergeriella denitrificans]
MNNIQIYQIFYDEKSKNEILDGFIPLDNTSSKGEGAEWYEFRAIRDFLNNHELSDDTVYGFVSPKFTSKTGLNAEKIKELIAKDINDYDVFMPTVHYYHIAFFLNPFEQGEYAHKGIIDLTKKVIDRLSWNFDIDNLVSSTDSFTFCNYIFAKKSYWIKWKKMADAFYNLVENDYTNLGEQLRGDTAYKGNKAAFRTFIQERFPAILLAKEFFNIKVFDTKKFFISPMFGPSKKQNFSHSAFEMCNIMKKFYLMTGDVRYLNSFFAIRSTIQVSSGLKDFIEPRQYNIGL